MSGMLGSLADNQIFGAGFGLFSVGLAATVAKKGMQVSIIWVEEMTRRTIFRLE